MAARDKAKDTTSSFPQMPPPPGSSAAAEAADPAADALAAASALSISMHWKTYSTKRRNSDAGLVRDSILLPEFTQFLNSHDLNSSCFASSCGWLKASSSALICFMTVWQRASPRRPSRSVPTRRPLSIASRCTSANAVTALWLSKKAVKKCTFTSKLPPHGSSSLATSATVRSRYHASTLHGTTTAASRAAAAALLSAFTPPPSSPSTKLCTCGSDDGSTWP